MTLIHLPKGHIPRAGCLSSDGTWASLPGHWVWTHPNRGHQFGSLYWLCTKKPEQVEKVTIHQCQTCCKDQHHYSKWETDEKLTWLPPMPWQLKMPTFSFSFLAMLSRHWLVSTLRICNRTDHTNRLDTLKQLSCMNKQSRLCLSVKHG